MIIGSGVDVIEIARIERVLGDRGDRFERRVFTPAEIEDCRRTARPATHYAVRFAAKEAVMKAVGTGWARGVRWVDIETRIAGSPEGAPGAQRTSDRLDLTLHGAVGSIADEMAAGAGGSARPHLAVGRSRTHAVATVLLEVRDR
jgi:holo-[acyl-carrier protein] synthase